MKSSTLELIKQLLEKLIARNRLGQEVVSGPIVPASRELQSGRLKILVNTCISASDGTARPVETVRVDQAFTERRPGALRHVVETQRQVSVGSLVQSHVHFARGSVHSYY